MRLLLITLGLTLSLLGQSALAGSYEDAVIAYNSGDYETAFDLFRPLAEQGNATAQCGLGFMYADGEGVPQNYVEAVKWFRRAAEQGFAIAQGSLGVMYDKGNGVPQDYAQAAKWYRKAADQGYAQAQKSLGDMLFRGEGIPQDYAQAHKWFNLAAAQGDKTAASIRDDLAKLMTPDQIAEAQRLARDWLASHPQ